MKPKNHPILTALLAALAGTLHLYGQGTAFTYQGRLNDANGPATGLYDLRFAIYDAASSGTLQGSLLTNSATAARNGLFTVTLDFGSQFNGADRWLEIGVQTNGGGGFSTLSPRQPLTPTPYAIFAGSASVAASAGSVAAANIAGTLAAAQLPTGVVTNNASGVTLSGTFIGDGAGLTNLSAAQLTSGTIPLAQLPASVLANGSGASGYIATALGASTTASGDYSTALGAYTTASGWSSTALGYGTVASSVISTALGYGTVASGWDSTAMGFFTTASGTVSTALGNNASATHDNSFVWADGQTGPFTSTANNEFSVRAGGGVRLVTGGAGLTVDGQPVLTNGSGASGLFSIALGTNTTASGQYSTALGLVTEATNLASTALGGYTTASGQYSTAMGGATKASGDESTAMGASTTASGWGSTALGAATKASGDYSTAMGAVTKASGDDSTAMGASTTASGFASTAMGAATKASGDYSTAMGASTTASGNYSTAMGVSAQATNDNSFVWSDGSNGPFTSTTTNQFSVQASGGVRLVTGGAGLTVDGQPVLTNGSGASGLYSTALGTSTTASGQYSTAMGAATMASGDQSTAMGASTTASGWGSTALGAATKASGWGSAALGAATKASGDYSTAMGASTTASGFASTALGAVTKASGDYSTAMGASTTASGNYSTAMGVSAQATNDNSFVWSDGSNGPFTSTTTNQFSVQASGGVRLVTGGAGLTVDGQPVLTNGGTFTGNGAGLTNIPASAVVGAPPGMVLIPAGAFTMGDSMGDSDIVNAATVTANVSAFYMDVNLVTLSQWELYYYWATNHGYGFVNPGAGKAANHPVQTLDWYDCVKWCNARSQQTGKTPVYYTDVGLTAVYTNGEATVYANWTAAGYRLPTEAEWEKAARGGLSGRRFPWGYIMNQDLANYRGSTGSYTYDLGPDGYNAVGSIGGISPATSPVGSFAANGYGLNDMAGNVFQWCWDWYGTPYAGGADPRGAVSGTARIHRGGFWYNGAGTCRTARRGLNNPAAQGDVGGFRSVLPPGQ